MKRRVLSCLMALVLVFGLLPATAFAEETPDAEPEVTAVEAPSAEEGETQLAAPKVKIGDTEYATLDEALKAAQDNDTIYLGEGTYSSYKSTAVKGKNLTLTFVGAGTDKTIWNMGTSVSGRADGGEDGDYSFDGSEKVTFKNMTLRSSVKDGTGEMVTRNNTGFVRIQHIVVDNCIIEGRTTYWGYTDTEFHNTKFYAPGHPELNGDQKLGENTKIEYALWTQTGSAFTFDTCEFYAAGKTINVYRDYNQGIYDVTINFNNCTVNSTAPESLSVMNINDSNMGNFKYVINFLGSNTVNGIKADGIQSTDGSHASSAKGTANGNKTSEQATCSKLFEFNMKYGNGNTGKTTVNIDEKPVWQGGKMVSHAIDTDNDKYTDGYKDNAFTITPLGEWKNNGDGTESREVTKTCNYCGYKTNDTETQKIAPIEWDVSKSKTATKLDTSTWTSNVTLSLPSAEENLASDVVFVLDGSSSANTDVVKKSLNLLGELKTAADDSGAAVNVCVVKFKRQAYKSDWFDLSKDFDAIQTAMETKYSGGTNIHAGLLAGQEALEEHTNVVAGRKYLILVSDGSTYLYSKGGNWASDTPFTRSYYTKENYKGAAGGFWDNGMYEPNNYPEVNVARPKTTSDVAAWQAYLADVKARNETVNSEGKTGDDYDYHCNYDLNFNQGKPSDDFKSQPCEPRTANNRDMAFYYADQVWQEIKNAGYNAYSIATEDGMAGAGNADDSHCFMNYLNGGESLNFSDIQQEILYAVGAGSTVEDKMGTAFDFVPGSLKLTVGGTELQSKADGNVTYFSDNAEELNETDCRFMVLYDPTADAFAWTINENVSNFAPVQLTYTVKLTTPETTPGMYGVEDLNGEKTLSDVEAKKALFTNAYAVLNAKNSAGAPAKAQEFLKPSVSYTVKSSGGGGGGSTTTYYYFAIEKVDAQDGHALNGAKFGLYLDGKQVATATSNRSGIALLRVSASDYRKINAKSELYYQELTAPEGYVVSGGKIGMEKDDLTTNQTTAEKKAETVRNYRGVTPDLLNDSDHFAYVIGYKDGNVRPYGLISRAETTTIFFRLLKDSVRDSNLLTSNTYTDVADDYWANTAISTMTGLGIVQGRSATTFDPKAPITRAQFAAICARFDTGKSSGTQTFTDIKGHWAEKYIQRAAELGWIKGFEDGSFRPDTYITRAQAMTMINRVLNRIPEENSDLLAGMNTWPDCNPGDWFYLAVQEATNSHDFKHKAGNYETWTGMNKNPDWTRYEH